MAHNGLKMKGTKFLAYVITVRSFHAARQVNPEAVTSERSSRMRSANMGNTVTTLLMSEAIKMIVNPQPPLITQKMKVFQTANTRKDPCEVCSSKFPFVKLLPKNV
jgi:hypothetical protein